MKLRIFKFIRPRCRLHFISIQTHRYAEYIKMSICCICITWRKCCVTEPEKNPETKKKKKKNQFRFYLMCFLAFFFVSAFCLPFHSRVLLPGGIHFWMRSRHDDLSFIFIIWEFDDRFGIGVSQVQTNQMGCNPNDQVIFCILFSFKGEILFHNFISFRPVSLIKS